MREPLACRQCDMLIASLPEEDRGFTVGVSGKDEPICRNCVKDIVLDSLESEGGLESSRGILADSRFASVILEAFSEVTPT